MDTEGAAEPVTLPASRLSAALAAVLHEPSLAPALPRACVTDGAPRELLDGLVAGRVRVLYRHATAIVDVTTLSAPGATLATWLASAPHAVLDEGARWLEARLVDRTPTIRLEPLGALKLWREELARGVRTTATLDALYTAACKEAAAFDQAAWGNRAGARELLDEAAGILARAHQTERRAA